MDAVVGQRIAHALERIADALELAIAPAQEPAPPTVCPHPLEARVDFGGMGGASEFQCRACGAHVTSAEVPAHV